MPDKAGKKPISFKASLLWGALSGAVIVGLDLVPAFSYRSFLFLSFASGTLGIWGLFSILIIRRSTDAKAAGLNVFAFLATMSVAFYLVWGIHDSIDSYQVFKTADAQTLAILAREGITTWVCFNWDLAVTWVGASLVCGAGAYFIVRLDGTVMGNILFAVPMAAMAGDAFSCSVSLITRSVGLAPAVINAAGYAYCAARQSGRDRDRLIVLICSCVLGAAQLLTML